MQLMGYVDFLNSCKMEYNSLTERIKDFMEQEARSCSMDFGCVTPEYVYRFWGGSASLDEIKVAMEDVRRMM